jgi:hypothetical protein
MRPQNTKKPGWKTGPEAEGKPRRAPPEGVTRTAQLLVSLRRREPGNEHAPGETDAKKINNAKAWTSDEDEGLRELVISNASVFDIAADLGRTVVAVRARAHALRIALGRSRFRVKANAK